MKYKTSELTGALLNAAVAVCEGWMTRGTEAPVTDAAEWVMPNGMKGVECPPDYSACWEHGGPILEREQIAVMLDDSKGKAWYANVRAWMSHDLVCTPDYGVGTTPLIAAMRAFVLSRHGDVVDL